MALGITKSEIDGLIASVGVGGLSSKINKDFVLGLDFIKSIEDREAQLMMKMFGEKMTPDGFRQKIKQLQQAQPLLKELYATGAKKIVDAYAAQSGNVDAMENLAFHQMLNDTVNSFEPHLRPANVQQLILHIVNQTFITNPVIEVGPGRSHAGRIFGLPSLRDTDLSEISNISLRQLADVTQLRVRQFLKDKGYLKNTNFRTKSGVRVSKNAIFVDNPLFDIYDITKGRKASEATDRMAKIANKKFTQNIQTVFNDPVMNSVVAYVLDKNPKALYSGNSYNQITGLLGEIGALYLMRKLGLKQGVQLKWLATDLGTTSGAKGQFHSDLSIFERYGVQVKNSISDIIGEIDFRDSSIRAFVDRLIFEGVIDGAAGESIMNIAEAYYFNQQYVFKSRNFHFGGGKSERGISVTHSSNPRFAATRNRIVALYSTLEGIFRSLAGQLLYIGVGDASKNQSANTIFFLGDRVLFASEILNDIYQNLNSEIQNLKVSINYKGSQDIVSAIYATNGRMFLDGLPSGYENSVANSIIVTSSFNFSSLLKKI